MILIQRWHVYYRPRIPVKARVAYHYLFFVRGLRRQRNLPKTSKRSLKSFKFSIVIVANIIMIQLMNIYLFAKPFI